MTLTDQLPSLRRTLPDPITIDVWPEETRARVDDVIVGGLSLRAVVSVAGTPCVHSGAAVVPGTGGMPSAELTASVVVAMVTRLIDRDGSSAVELDVDVQDVPVLWSEARLIGRTSVAKRRIRPIVREAHGLGAALLVDDLHPGDLLAFPCAGHVQVRHGVLVPERAASEGWLATLR